MIVAVDPGSEQSAWVVWDGQKIIDKGLEPNDAVLGWCCHCPLPTTHLAIEYPQAYTMQTTGGRAFFPQQIIHTSVWIGRFIEAWGRDWTPVDRRAVKLHVVGRANCGDSQVRQALEAQIGPKGTKKAPGPTYGVRKDIWAALGVAVTWWDTLRLPSS